MVGMFKICDFCGAREEKEFERWSVGCIFAEMVNGSIFFQAECLGAQVLQYVE